MTDLGRLSRVSLPGRGRGGSVKSIKRQWFYLREDFAASYAGRPLVPSVLSAATQASFLAVAAYRLSRGLVETPLWPLAHLVKLANRIAFSVEIAPSAEIGQGFVLGHGLGVVIGGRSRIGDHCFVAQGVTIGGNFGKLREVDEKCTSQPTIGAESWVLAGAVVAGPVRLGQGVVVGANAVVTRDLEEWTVYGGVPARPLRENDIRRAPVARASGGTLSSD